MLTLTPGCACDVCAEEYGPHRLPHSIPCGHVLCANCCHTIVEKTNPRLSPVCPFCRESFSADSMRVIRMDFATSGWTTPRRVPALESLTDINSDILQRKTAHLFSSPDGTRTRIEVRRLEDKVSRIAAKKCSVEEVSTLYKELEEWLLAEKDDQTTSLFLSAALLRAILMNHLAHSEASKAAKTADANLRHKIEDLELNNTRLDAELRRQRAQYNQKAQECSQLRTEVNQLRALASTLGGSPADLPPPTAPATQSTTAFPYTSSSAHTHASAASPPSSHSTSPTPYSSSQSHYPSSSASASASVLSRFNSMHGRSASMSSRPTTPASISLSHSQQPISPTRSHTPAPPRSHTPGPSPARSHTPGPPRSHTPAPGLSSASAAAAAHAAVRSHTPSLMRSQTPVGPPPVPTLPTRYATPSPGSGGHAGPPLSASTGMGYGFRAQTPAPAMIVPPKPRRLSLSGTSPPKMMNRSTSDEKAEAHQRWLPPSLSVSGGLGAGGGRGVVDDYEYSGKGHARSGSRAGFRP